MQATLIWGRLPVGRPTTWQHEAMTCQLGLRVLDNGGMISLVPEIDGQSLIELVAAYESTQGYTPAGGYGGLVPDNFTFGPLPEYYLGTAAPQWPGPGHAWLLACDCGEAGCWPLEARVEPTDDTVTWSEFHQPHRPSWDYSGFGPFQFDRSQYETAVAEAVRSLAR